MWDISQKSLSRPSVKTPASHCASVDSRCSLWDLMTYSEIQEYGASHPLDLQQLRATQRGVVVGALGFPFLAHKSHTSHGVVFESGADLIGFAVGAAFLGAWFGLGFLSPAFWVLEKTVLKLIGRNDQSQGE